MEWSKIDWWCTESIKTLMSALRTRRLNEPSLGAKLRDLRARSAEMTTWEASAMEALQGSSERVMQARTSLDDEIASGALSPDDAARIDEALSAGAKLLLGIAALGDGTSAIRKRIAETVDVASRASAGLIPEDAAFSEISKLQQELHGAAVPNEWSALAN